MEAFGFNSDAKYKTGGVYPPNLIAKNLTLLMVTVPNNVFFTEVPDIWQQYRLPEVQTDSTVQAWNRTPMQFWQNQLNFAIWCATAGCGVSFQDHMVSDAEKPLMQSLYVFHVYYTTRRILAEMKVALPQDSSWDALNNNYDHRAYERICDEFGVSKAADWKQKKNPNSGGLGDVHTRGHVAWRQTDFRNDNPDKHITSQNVGDLDPEHMTFGPEISGGRHCGISSCDWKAPKKAHIDFIQQNAAVDGAWSEFVLDNSIGFTQAGVVRLNDSIRTYVWALLGAQAQTRSPIIGKGTAFDAQKQFISNVEDAISAPVDLPSAIQRYQDVLQYAATPVDFVFGKGLYMAPSDMLMRVGNVAGYNNEIVVATKDLPLGRVERLNEVAEVPQPHGSFNDNKIASPPVPDPTAATPHKAVDNHHEAPVPDPTAATPHKAADNHNEEKTALVVGGIAVGLAALWLMR